VCVLCVFVVCVYACVSVCGVCVYCVCVCVCVRVHAFVHACSAMQCSVVLL